MTIRQQGGIFGRNPAFNDVSVEKLGVGTNAPLGDVQFNKPNPDFYMTSVNGGQTDIFFGSVSSPSEGNIKYSTFDNSMRIWTNGAEAVRIEGDGDLNVRIGNVIMASGKGIDFSATSGTGTSELFDDYEEGTFTPTLITDGTQFTSVTYDTLVTAGRYTKIGNVVHVQGSLRTDAVTVGSASGSVCVGNLPFTVTANTVGTQNGISAISIGAASAWAGEQPISATTVANTTRFELLYRTAVDGATANTAVADVGTGADDNIIRFSATYIAA